MTCEKVIKHIPDKITRAVALFMRQTAKTFLASKGPGFRVTDARVMLRATSDREGFCVRVPPQHGFTNSNMIEFVWALSGVGHINVAPSP